jgi:hypothetical protein
MLMHADIDESAECRDVGCYSFPDPAALEILAVQAVIETV